LCFHLLPIHPFDCMSIHSSLYPSLRLYLRPSIHLFIEKSVYDCVIESKQSIEYVCACVSERERERWLRNCSFVPQQPILK
jgi:hypothetical protein